MELQKSNNSKKKSKTKSNFKLNYQPKPEEVKKIQKISESSQPLCAIRYKIDNIKRGADSRWPRIIPHGAG